MLLAQFKKVFVEAKDFADIWNCFFDLNDQGILSKNSKAIPEFTKKPVLVALLGFIQHTLKGETISPLKFLEIPSENFYHGNFLIHEKSPSGIFFYFSDIDMGAFTYVKLPAGTSEMFRFSLAKITDPKDFSSLH